MKKKIATSFIVNIVGLVSLYIIDLKVTQSNDIELISSWALTKSVLFIGVLFVLLGLDQAIVRLKLKLKDIFALALVQFFVMTVSIVGFLSFFNLKHDVKALIPSLFLLAVSYLLYATFRLNMDYVRSQSFLQSWKIILLIILLVYGIDSFGVFLPLSLAVSLLLLTNREIYASLSPKYINFSKYTNSLKTGLHYFMSLATLTASLYFDQLLLNFDAKQLESSILFTHVTFFVGPIAIFLGFAGFILGPYLRNNPDKKRSFFKKTILIYSVLGIVLSLMSYAFGMVLFHYFKPNKEISILLSVSLEVVVLLRYLYILPSVYIGSFATNALIRQVSMFNIVGLLFYLIAYFVVSRVMDDYILAIVLAMITVWSVRIVNGYYAIYLILKSDEDESV